LPAVVARKSPLAILFLTVFVDLVGFGILIPILPDYAKSFGASATQIGLLNAIYSLMQMAFAPVWGRLSDRVGRRPVIVATALAGCVAYLVFGFASSLWLLFLARGFAGVCGANIATAQAYVADVTTPETRARGMGMIGAALGLGFTVGPAVGGLAAHYGNQHTPFFVAAGLAAVNAGWAFVALPEPERHAQRPTRGFATYADALRIPALAFFVALFLLVTYAFSNIETAFVLYTHDVFGFSKGANGLMFTLIGVVLVLMQGLAVRPLTRRFGSERLITAGTLTTALGAALLVMARAPWQLIPPTIIIAAGTAMYSPSLSATISVSAPAERQGEMLGVSQSAGALGRILGPGGAGFIYEHAGNVWPFLTCAVLLGVASLASAARRAASTRTPTAR
jgi:DHA1 family tetracycline resistance protein-like MFS transporter